MRRLFWIAVGAGATVYVMRRSKAGLANLLPPAFGRALGSGHRSYSDGLIDGLAAGAGGFFADVKAGMSQREAELQAALLAEPAPESRSEHRSTNGISYDLDDEVFEF